MTAITEAKSLLNSRPLTYQTGNIDDDVPLTPNHFLHGQMGGRLAPETVDQTKTMETSSRIGEAFLGTLVERMATRSEPNYKMAQRKK